VPTQQRTAYLHDPPPPSNSRIDSGARSRCTIGSGYAGLWKRPLGKPLLDTSMHRPAAARKLQLWQVLHCYLRPLSVWIGGILPGSVNE
jgi:hypothetical protein